MPMLQIPRFLENQVFKASPDDYGYVPPYRDGSYASKSTGWTQQADFPKVSVKTGIWDAGNSILVIIWIHKMPEISSSKNKI